MTNEEKAIRIRPWINQTEPVKVHFLGEHAYDAIVTGCSDTLVDFSIEPGPAFLRQSIAVPLSRVRITIEQESHAQDAERTQDERRLLLFVEDKRPPMIY